MTRFTINTDPIDPDREGNNIGQNTDKGFASSPRIEIKISDPAGLEGRDSTDHATATNLLTFHVPNLISLFVFPGLTK